MDLEVVIEGVSETGVEREMKRQIQKICKEARRSGEWTVLVSPSEMRGQWDLSVRGPFGQHIASSTEPVEQLPGWVADELRACLDVA